jgi:histidinol-phosphate phosphatase family protein
VQAIVLAGGQGTRLGASPDAPPKVLLPLAGAPALDHVLAWLAREGVVDVVLCLGHRAAEIQKEVGDGARFGLRVRTAVESSPLGTAGAVKSAESLLDPRFFVVYGDVVCDVDLARMTQRHVASGALATLAVHPSDHAFDSDRVVTDASGRILRLVRKEERVGADAGALVSAALYVVERALLAHVPSDGRARDFARDVFPGLLAENANRSLLVAHRTTEYIKDMGTPERRDRVDRDLREGRPARMRLGADRPAVFVDRDGVLISDAPFITRPSQVDVLPAVASALRAVNEAGMLAVCCTNQPVVARGDLSLPGLHELHTLLEGKLGQEGAWLDAFYVCPHHPDRGFDGERPELKIACDCRKPLPGLLLRAAAELGVDRRASVFVGDRTIDLRAARAAGVLGIGVLTGTALRDGVFPIAPETPIVPTFAEAVSFVLGTVPSWRAHLEEAKRAGVVLIGGVSRSGKTTAASALALALRAEGTPALHVSLDRFIEPASSRRAPSPLAERTGSRAARAYFEKLSRHEATLIPSYDPLRRETAPGEMVTWADGVLVVEGLFAGALDAPGALHVEMVAEKTSLGDRRRAFYAWKGLAPADIEAVLAERDTEDVELAALGAVGRDATHGGTPRRLIFRVDDLRRLELTS